MLLIFVATLAVATAQPAWVGRLPEPPETCSADVVKGIQWGSATSAYQVEGAWNESGRSPSVWDTLAHTPGKIADNSTGDVAVDMYHRWQQDIQLMKDLGIKNYRLSLSWPRIVPQGVAGSPINAAGIAWYRTFITALLQAGIKPAVTLFHWDLPQVLQDKYQGFLDPRIQEDFLYYADAVFHQLGDLVDQWMTFNEVISICELGYQMDIFAPAMGLGLWAKYRCGHNIVLAHAKTVQLYRQKYKPSQGGRISIALDGKWGYARDPNNTADVQAAEYFMQFQYGWMADPIYFGDYPKIMLETQGDALPRFTEAEKALLLANKIDFLSVNFYTGYYVWAPPKNASKSQLFVATYPFISPGIPSNAAWLFKTPDAFRNTLVWLHKRYSGPELWITESGVSGPGEESKGRDFAVRDDFRLDYFKTYLDYMCQAKTKHAVNVTHYYAWALLDNFEWRDGFTKRFGIVYVDLQNNLARQPKMSAYWLSKNFFTVGPSPSFTTKQQQQHQPQHQRQQGERQ